MALSRWLHPVEEKRCFNLHAGAGQVRCTRPSTVFRMQACACGFLHPVIVLYHVFELLTLKGGAHEATAEGWTTLPGRLYDGWWAAAPCRRGPRPPLGPQSEGRLSRGREAAKKICHNETTHDSKGSRQMTDD
jgi:hypothetical protein